MDKRNYTDIFQSCIYAFSSIWKVDKIVVIIFGIYELLSKITPFVLLFLPMFVVNELSSASPDWRRVAIIIVTMLTGVATANFLQRYIYSQTSVRFIKYRLAKQTEIALKTLYIDYENMEDPEALASCGLAKDAVTTFNTGMEGMLRASFSFFFDILSIIGYIIILFTLSPFIVLFLIIITFIIHFSNERITTYAVGRRKDSQKIDRRLQYYLSTMADFAYGKEIRLYSLYDFFSMKFRYYVNKGEVVLKDVENKRLKILFVINIVNAIKEFLCIGFLIRSIWIGKHSIGSFFIYFGAFSNFSNWVKGLTDTMSDFRTIDAQINDFNQFMLIPNTEWRGNKTLRSIENIVFDDVCFRYPHRDYDVLSNITFRFEKGKKYAIVGKNGQGKTTLIKLLCGFYKPTNGRILVNDIPMEEYIREDYIRQVSVLFQEINIFAFSMESNIALTQDSLIDQERLMQCVQDSDALGLLQKLPKGLRTSLLKILDEEGVELSGGERQKVVMARAIYKGGDLLIMDEPTANLDAIAEKAIYEKYIDVSKDKLAIFISHRLASTQFCDTILFIDEGKIVESGTHDELIRLGALFADMYNIQSVFYKDDDQALQEAKERK